jgi:hypothetical protein
MRHVRLTLSGESYIETITRVSEHTSTHRPDLIPAFALEQLSSFKQQMVGSKISIDLNYVVRQQEDGPADNSEKLDGPADDSDESDQSNISSSSDDEPSRHKRFTTQKHKKRTTNPKFKLSDDQINKRTEGIKKATQQILQF